jgi:hypothetical protein
MGTRSNIGIIHEDNTVTMIYCHWDGYPSNNGRILLDHYMDLEKIQQLMDLGSLSSLKEEIGEKHDFESRDHENWCMAYGRDRGETDVSAIEYSSKEEALQNMEEYLYLWDKNKKSKNKWIMSNHQKDFVSLTKKLCK